MNPVEVRNRIEILDYLRGFALLGILLVNIVPLLAVKNPAPNTSDAAYQLFLYLFVEGRFYTIFSFLFGVGFYLFLNRANRKGNNGTALFLRRMLALFFIGIIHVQFHPGEALLVYALSGIIIFPFYRLPKRVNLTAGILLMIVFSFLSVKIFMTIPLMLLGICAGQYRVFEDISNKTKKVAAFTVIMLMISITGFINQIGYMPSVLGRGQTQRFLEAGIMIGPAVSAVYSGVFILALRLSMVKKLLLPLKYYGRMALTNYIFQTVLILVFGHVFSHDSHITYLQTIYICVAVYTIQLVFSTVWLHYFRFGPLEWIWRIVTYGNIPPIK